MLPVLALVAAVMGPNARVGAEDLPVYDPRVEHALTLLDASPATTQLRGVLDNNRVGVHFLPMGPGVYARYSVARHVIEIIAAAYRSAETRQAQDLETTF